MGQTQPSNSGFQQFPVKQIYRGKPAPPLLNHRQRLFRTVIRTGAASAVQFAGHYTVPEFGCGGGCTDFYIVDSMSGRVYDGFAVVELPGRWEEKHLGNPHDRIEFLPSSRLFRVNGCPNERDCGFYDFVMVDGKGLKLLGKQLLPKDFQP